MTLSPQTAVVFGGTGFIGRHIVQRLARQGMIVRAPTRSPEAAGFLKVSGKVGQIAPARCNVHDDAAVAAMVQGADVVINLIATFKTKDFQRLHVDVAARIAKACTEAGVKRLVHFSALGADPQSPALYGRTKAQGEQAVLKAYPMATLFRPSVVFGPEDKFFNRFAAMTLISPFLPLIGGGKSRFQPVYVGDVADAVMRTLDKDSSRGVTYELGGPKVYTFRELMAFLLTTLRRRRMLLSIPFGLARFEAWFLEFLPSPPLTRDQVDMLKKDTVVGQAAHTLQELGIEPRALETVVPAYVEGFRKGGRFGGEQK